MPLLERTEVLVRFSVSSGTARRACYERRATADAAAQRTGSLLTLWTNALRSRIGRCMRAAWKETCRVSARTDPLRPRWSHGTRGGCACVSGLRSCSSRPRRKHLRGNTTRAETLVRCADRSEIQYFRAGHAATRPCDSGCGRGWQGAYFNLAARRPSPSSARSLYARVSPLTYSRNPRSELGPRELELRLPMQ